MTICDYQNPPLIIMKVLLKTTQFRYLQSLVKVNVLGVHAIGNIKRCYATTADNKKAQTLVNAGLF